MPITPMSRIKSVGILMKEIIRRITVIPNRLKMIKGLRVPIMSDNDPMNIRLTV